MVQISISTNVDLQNYKKRIDSVCKLMSPEGIEIFSLPYNYPNKFYSQLEEKHESKFPVLSKSLALEIGKKLRKNRIKKVQFHYPWQKHPLDMNGSDINFTIQFCDLVLEESGAEQLTINYHNSFKHYPDKLKKLNSEFRKNLLNSFELQTQIMKDIRDELDSECLLNVENNPAVALIKDSNGNLVQDIVDQVSEDFINRKWIDGITFDYSHAWLVMEYFRRNEQKFANMELCRKQYGGVPNSAKSMNNFVKSVASRIKWIHLSDEVHPYQHEGLHIGEGKIDFNECAELLKKYLKKDVVVTIEVLDGHTPEGYKKIVEKDFPLLKELLS